MPNVDFEFKTAYAEKSDKWMNQLRTAMVNQYSIPEAEFDRIVETIARSFYLTGRLDESEMWK